MANQLLAIPDAQIKLWSGGNEPSQRIQPISGASITLPVSRWEEDQTVNNKICYNLSSRLNKITVEINLGLLKTHLWLINLIEGNADIKARVRLTRTQGFSLLCTKGKAGYNIRTPEKQHARFQIIYKAEKWTWQSE